MAGIKKMHNEMVVARIEAAGLRFEAKVLTARADALERVASANEQMIKRARSSARLARKVRLKMASVKEQTAQTSVQLHEQTLTFKRESQEYLRAVRLLLSQADNGLIQLATMSTGYSEEVSIVSTSLAELIRLKMLIQ